MSTAGPIDYFGEGVAARYDADTAGVSTPEAVAPVVDFLANLAGDGSALEFGIGTGRIGIPLHRRGVPVHGIDLSEAMLERLRIKAGTETLGVIRGDFATTTVDGLFNVVFVVFNTINNLTTQDAQVACFQNAADHLAPGGHFVVEVEVPAVRLIPPGQNFHVFHISDERWSVDEYHFASQNFTSHHLATRNGELHRNSIPFRYVFPEELDLMARLADMRRTARWAGWEREPFTDDSTKHVSVWQKDEGSHRS
ncbi:MAG: class I SAM-dependent methyltransferase [Acidimicrobiia bacterium]